MNEHRTLIGGLFVSACAALDGAMAIQSQGALRSTGSLVLVGLAFGQAALAAIWVAAGNQTFLARLWRFLLAAAFLAAPLALATTLNWRQSLGMLMVLTILTSAPLALLRVGGWRVRLMGESTPNTEPAAGISSGLPRTFSVKGLLLLITTCALLLGAARWIAFPSALAAIATQCAGFAVAALAAWWCVLGQGPLALRLALGVAVCGLLGMLRGHIDGRLQPLILIVAIESLMVAAGAAALRVTGHCFAPCAAR